MAKSKKKATKKIEQLTPEQERDLVSFRNQWLGIGLSTEPADFEKAKQVISDFYRQINKPIPTFYCLPSPSACALKAKEVCNVNAQTFLSQSFYGQYESYWISYYLFAERIGVEYEENDSKVLAQWAEIAKSVNWWTPFDDVCFISDRPRVIKFDNEERLHCENGQAVEYSDGWGVASWHGVRIPRDWILKKESLTAKTALTWPNVEQRRAACEILGWINILNELNGVTIDADADPEIGELIEVDIPDIGKERFLKVQCGTGRTFALPVPPNMQTALQAQSWTWGVDNVSEWMKPEIRT